MASLGGVFGSIPRTVAVLRRQVCPDGFMLIDDAYLSDRERFDRKGYEYCRDRETTIEQLQVHRDRIVAEIDTTAASRKINAQYIDAIQKRGQELSIEHPELQPAVESYINSQIEECDIIDQELRGVLWALRKESSG